MEWFPPSLPAIFQTLNPVLFCLFYLVCSDLDDGTNKTTLERIVIILKLIVGYMKVRSCFHVLQCKNYIFGYS